MKHVEIKNVFKNKLLKKVDKQFRDIETLPDYNFSTYWEEKKEIENILNSYKFKN